MDLHNIREDYSKRELSESECHADPIVQFEQWLNEAIHSQVNEPTAVNVASVGEDGRPNSRMVLLKEVNPQGFVFFSNYLSRKGRSFDAHPFAAMTFFWPELERQVRVEGRIENWMPPLRTNISTAAPTPAASVHGQARKVKYCRAKRCWLPKRRQWARNTRCTSRARRIGAAISSFPTASNSGRAVPAACTTASNTVWLTATGYASGCRLKLPTASSR